VQIALIQTFDSTWKRTYLLHLYYSVLLDAQSVLNTLKPQFHENDRNLCASFDKFLYRH